MSIYLNNAATTWPKPSCVAEAMADFMTRGGANLGRGTSSDRDLETMNIVLDCRIRIADLLGGWENADPRYVTFSSGVTESLNVVLKGLHRSVPGLRVVTSSMEHNAVMRPLRSMERDGASVEVVPCDSDGLLRPEVLDRVLKRRAGLVVLSHASNVCGTIQPLEELAAVCRDRDRPVPLAVDAAQTAGVLPIRAADWGISALCFTGHKGLMGPQGTGGIVWDPKFARRVFPLIEGGTGSYSHIEVQPPDLPDRFESGTPNLPGIAGLSAALDWLERTGIGTIEKRERALGGYFLKTLRERVPDVIVYGRRTMTGRLPVFALNVPRATSAPDSSRSPETPLVDNGLLGDELSKMGFETRPGLHCAPQAHRTLGSFPEGSLRVSVGFFNTEDEIDRFAAALPEAIGRCTHRR